jgi:hypothetical protein
MKPILKNIPTATTLKTKHRKTLNPTQTELLIALYKFRFGTAELISQYQEQSLRYTNIRLKILLEQEYIGRNYEPSYRIHGRPANYYLLPKAIRLLKVNPELDLKGLHLQYYNRTAKANFINHWLRLLKLYLKLDSLYGEDLELYTSSELAGQTRFARPLADAFLSFSGKYRNTPDSLLELIEGTTPLDRVRQRLNRYVRHCEAGDYGSKYPRLLLVCDNGGLEREIQRYMARTIANHGINMQCYTTKIRALVGLSVVKEAVWTDVSQLENKVSLHS